jgi:hypothetical protein
MPFADPSVAAGAPCVVCPKPRLRAQAAETAEDGVLREQADDDHPLRPVGIAILAQAGEEALSGSTEARAFLLGEAEFGESIETWCEVAGPSWRPAN